MNRLTTHKNFVLNGDLGNWSGGVPTNFDIDQTLTTVVQLQRAQQQFHDGLAQVLKTETKGFASDIPAAANPLVRSGSSALRFRHLAGSAGDWALRTSGITAAHTTAPTGQRLPMEPSMTSRFTWWSRGTPGALYTFNVILQRATTNVLYLQPVAPNHQPQAGNAGSWTTTVNGLTYPLTAEWHQYSIEFQPAAFSTAVVDDQVMFEISNIDTGVHIADFDSIEYLLEDPVNSQGSV